jgi:hypothetical protein
MKEDDGISPAPVILTGFQSVDRLPVPPSRESCYLIVVSEQPLDQPPFSDKGSQDGLILILQDWIGVQRQIESAHRMEEHSVRYGSSAIQAAYVLNGGALAAVPPLMQGISTASRSGIPHAAVPFVLGIAFAAGASLNAFLNLQFNALQSLANAEIAKQGLPQLYGSGPTNRPKKDYQRRIKRTLWLSVGFALSSFIAFVVGVFLFIGLASAFPANEQRAEPGPAVQQPQLSQPQP